MEAEYAKLPQIKLASQSLQTKSAYNLLSDPQESYSPYPELYR